MEFQLWEEQINTLKEQIEALTEGFRILAIQNLSKEESVLHFQTLSQQISQDILQTRNLMSDLANDKQIQRLQEANKHALLTNTRLVKKIQQDQTDFQERVKKK